MNTLRKALAFVLLMLIVASSLFSCLPAKNNNNTNNNSNIIDSNNSKKVLLVSIDGMRPDAFMMSKYAQDLLGSSTYYMGATTVYPSVTLPCHMSMHHSVSPEVHGVLNNTYTPAADLTDGIAENLSKVGKTSAFFYNWRELGDVILDDALVKKEYVPGETIGWAEANIQLASACKEYILANDVDFTFLYLGYLDEMGHAHGWLSDVYLEALDSSLELVIGIIDALSDEYTVIITTDHGGHGNTHGSDLAEDMTMPILIIGDGFPGGIEKNGGSILDIAPTVAEILGVAPCSSWEGSSLK